MAAKTEWFRRGSWTPADETEFMTRLKCSRSAFHKAQYLRIQAHHLVEDADPPLHHSALGLLDILLRDFPDPSQLATAHQQRARCLAALGRKTNALDELLLSLEAERTHSGVQGHAYLDFAELVLELGRNDLFREALSALGARRTQEVFPIAQYRNAAAAAFLCEHLGLTDASRTHALDALAAAAKTETPFRYHRHLGLMNHADPNLQRRLWKLAGKSS